MTPQAATHPAEMELFEPRLLTSRPALRGSHPRAYGDPQVWRRLRAVADTILLILAATTAALTAPQIGGSPVNVGVCLLFPLVSLVLVRSRARLDDAFDTSLLETAVRVVGLVSATAMVSIAGLALVDQRAGHLVLRLWFISAAYVAGGRIAILLLQRRAALSGRYAVPTLIVGAGVVGARLVKRLRAEPRYGLRPVGFLDADPLPRDASADASLLPVMGSSHDLEEAIQRTGARHVILSFSSEPDHVLAARIQRCQELGVEVSLVPRLFELINDRSTLNHLGGMPLVSLRPTNPHSWQFAVKHAMDRAMAVCLLLILSPLMLLIAALVKLTSPGPALFRQRRVGRDDHEFTMLKFRTMRDDPVGAGEADSGWALQVLGGGGTASGGRTETRVTKVGRILRSTSLDELPQLINVLRGDMSFVGPRPERVSYVNDFKQVVHRYGDRHRVKSGLTGWAQVNGLRGETSIADRVEWDNYYIQNYSLRLDLRILTLTIAEVFRFRG